MSRVNPGSRRGAGSIRSSRRLRAAVILVVAVSLAGSGLGVADNQRTGYRSIDGVGNNLRHAKWGSAGVELLRITRPDYGDGRSTPAGLSRPGAREVSNSCSPQEGPRPNGKEMSHFLWAWGQFVDHDISLTGSADPAERMDIAVPAGDPYFNPAGTGEMVIPVLRSVYGKGRVRQQLNQITAWIDGSQVYGSNEARARALRRKGGSGDRLKTGGSGLLPLNKRGFANAPADHDRSFFLAGDVRANENLALTSLHVLFVREHNRIVRGLRRQQELGSEERYLMARALVGAEIQAITYNEFLPALLGSGALRPYTGYNRRINPAISNLFSTAVFRFGHSLLPRRLRRLGPDGRSIPAGHIRLRDAFFAPDELVQTGVEPILRGLASSRSQEVDTLVVDEVRNFLFGRPGQGGFDLAALNIQRGRDHGLPSYNQARSDLGLAPAGSFAEVTSDPEAQRRLAEIYASVDVIDVWVGVLAEDHMPGAMVGEFIFHVGGDQFERLRDGDRFWYQHSLSSELVDWVEEHNLARIIRLNTSIGDELQDDLFRMP